MKTENKFSGNHNSIYGLRNQMKHDIKCVGLKVLTKEKFMYFFSFAISYQERWSACYPSHFQYLIEKKEIMKNDRSTYN